MFVISTYVVYASLFWCNLAG